MSLIKKAARVRGKFQNPIPTELGGLSLMLKVLPQYLANTEERVPYGRLGPFQTDPAAYATEPESGLRVTWFGHSSTLVEIDGVRILIDPVWDERASPVQWFGPRRFFPPVLSLDDLPPLDAILISHDHYDHLGEGTIRQLAQLRPDLRWVTSLGVGAILRSFGVTAAQITELDWTDTVTIAASGGASCEIVSLPARHFSGRSLRNRFETLWASFVLRGSEHRLYYGADSGVWDGFEEIGRLHGPFDLTMLEIGAFNELWRAIHLGPEGAAEAFRAMGGSGLLMPIHWGLFDLALHGWRQPMEQMEAVAAQLRLALWQPEPGRPCEVVRNVPLRSDWWRRSGTARTNGHLR